MDLFSWADEMDARRPKPCEVIDICDILDARIHQYFDLVELGYKPKLEGTLLPFSPLQTDERRRA